MQPSDLIAQLSVMEKKIHQLIAQRNQLKQQVTAAEQKLALAKKEKSELKETIQQQSAQIKLLTKKLQSRENNFNNPAKISKIVHSIQADSPETAELKARINEYIQELDKCIAHLSRS